MPVVTTRRARLRVARVEVRAQFPTVGRMSLNVAFYEAVAQLVPVFLLALVVDMGIDGLKGRERRANAGALILAFILDAVLVMSMCLGVIAMQRDDPLIAAVTVLLTGGVVSAFLITVVFRIPSHRDLPSMHLAVAASPLAIASLAGFAVLLTA